MSFESEFVSDTDSLKVVLFQNTFEIANPLRSAKQKHTILVVYFTLGNFHPHNRSSVDQIQLVLLCSEKDCKYFGVDKVFAKVVLDLCELETKGISFEGKLYRGSVA